MAKRGGTLKDYVETLGLRWFFLFLDYVSDVEPVLEGCDILIRASRGKDPWGRDVIEAMAHGKPVIATGSYDRFVEDGINGYLFSEYDSQAIAEKIVFLFDHPEAVETMAIANREKARQLFDGTQNAKKVAAVYDSVLHA
jgi:glycosyltransferase involved in cell wall biosynthesis